VEKKALQGKTENSSTHQTKGNGKGDRRSPENLCYSTGTSVGSERGRRDFDPLGKKDENRYSRKGRKAAGGPGEERRQRTRKSNVSPHRRSQSNKSGRESARSDGGAHKPEKGGIEGDEDVYIAPRTGRLHRGGRLICEAIALEPTRQNQLAYQKTTEGDLPRKAKASSQDVGRRVKATGGCFPSALIIKTDVCNGLRQGGQGKWLCLIVPAGSKFETGGQQSPGTTVCGT